MRSQDVDFTQVEELDERMQKLTHKLENARRDIGPATLAHLDRLDRGAAIDPWTTHATV